MPDAASPLLRALQRRTAYPFPAALVVAHPDDETIAAGGSLHLLPDLLLVHVTDGAPRALGDAAREGFATPAAYAAARESELQAALALSGASPRRVALGIPDQDASLHMPPIAGALSALFRQHGIRSVLTHAYEGGHPDHDATCLAVHMAAGAAEVVEFAGYHAGPDGSLVVQRFLGEGAAVSLPPEDAERKRAMLSCFRSQAGILSHFSAATERFRPSLPEFAAPPHPGLLNYEHWGWDMTGARWRALARQAMDAARCAA